MHDPDQIDPFDRRILAALQHDGRLSNQELADRVGLSSSQCSRRRTVLERDGAISGYTARLDAERLGFGVLAFVQVSLTHHSPDNARAFRELVARTGAIQAAHALTGDADYLLRVVLPDLKSLSRLVNEVLLPQPGVTHVRSSIVLEQLKDTRDLPVTP